MLQICRHIKYIRESKGIALGQIASRLEIHRNTYGNFENNTEPPIEMIKKIAAVLGVTYIDIIDGLGAQPPKIQDMEDYEITVTIKKSDAERIAASSGELGLIFSHALALEKDKKTHVSDVRLEGNKSIHQKEKGKDRRRDI